jgi:polyhydroxybutyrate depolymerase
MGPSAHADDADRIDGVASDAAACSALQPGIDAMPVLRLLSACAVVATLTAFTSLGQASRPAPGWYDDRSISIGGVDRYFRYYVPEELASPPPAVLFLHGGNRSMRTAMPPASNGSAAWPDVADEHGFILIVPNGTDGQTGDAFGDGQVWNDCRIGAPASRADDVGFLSTLIDWSVSRLGVDERRVYVTGASNGGLMTYRMAIEAGERIAAIAPFIANQPVGSECLQPNEPIPVMITVGTADPLVPFDGGEVSVSGTLVRSAETTRDLWRAQNGVLDVEPVVTTFPDVEPVDGSTVEAELFGDPETDVPVRFVRMIGAGHAIPSRSRRLSGAVESIVGPQNHDIEGAVEAWSFLSQFSRDDSAEPASPPGSLKMRSDTDAQRDASGTGQLFESIHVPPLTDFAQGANGIAIADLNRDGWLDLVTVTTPPLKLGLNDSLVRDRLRFLINRGGFEFESQAIELSGSPATPEDLGQGWRGSQIPALADFNDDGFLDLFVSRQCPCEGGQVRDGFTAVGNSLFLSDGAFDRFADRSEALGVLNEMAYNRQPSIGDVDQDGFLDIAVGADNTTNAFEGVSQSALFMFEPGEQGFEDGRYVDIGGTERIPDYGGFTGDPAEDTAGPNVVLRDMDNDGDLDLLQSTRVLLGAPPVDARILPVSPVRYRQGVFTWRNQLAETGMFDFVKSSDNGLASEARLAFDEDQGLYLPASDDRAPGLAYLLTADVDNDGLFDVIAVDASDQTFTPKTLDIGGRFWRNNGAFRFTEATIEAGLASLNDTYGDWYEFFENTIPMAAMGRIPVTRFLPAQPGLEPIVPVDLRPYHADVVFADFDNDTWVDFVLLDRRESSLLEPRGVFYHNQGDGSFEPLPTTLSGLDGTGIAGEAADLDNDGRVDLIVSGDPDNSNDNEAFFASADRYVDKVYRNTGALGADNHWLRMRFSGLSDAQLIGARVEIFALDGNRLGTRGVYTNHAYKTGSALQVHFGLGQHELVDLRATLPSGEVFEFASVAANQFLDVDLGAGTLRSLEATPRSSALTARSEGQWVAADPAFRDWAQGLAFDFLEGPDVLFVSWYTYRTDPAPDELTPDGDIGAPDQRWLTGQLDVDGDRASGPIFSTTGGVFGAGSVPTLLTREIGTMTIRFDSCTRAGVNYALDDSSLARGFEIMPLSLLVSNSADCSQPGAVARAVEPGDPDDSTDWLENSDGQWVNASDAFVNAREGLTFDYLPNNEVLFAAWFTWPTVAAPDDNASSVVPGHRDQRWLTAQLDVSDNRAEGPIFSSTGGAFDAPGTGFRTTTKVGTMTVEFTACDRALISYEFSDPERSGSFEITPLESRVSDVDRRSASPF